MTKKFQILIWGSKNGLWARKITKKLLDFHFSFHPTKLFSVFYIVPDTYTCHLLSFHNLWKLDMRTHIVFYFGNVIPIQDTT